MEGQSKRDNGEVGKKLSGREWDGWGGWLARMAGEDGWGSFSCVTVTTGRLVSNAPIDGSTLCACGQH